jgi:uncharacterized protein YndB with AHSA1/START domain
VTLHRNEHAVTIDVPPEDVFPWLAESERRLRWMGALVESEPLTDGPVAEGSRFRDVFEDHGRRVELESELVEVDAPRRLVVHLVSSSFESTIVQTLEDEGGATRFRTVLETTYTVRGARFLAPLATGLAQRRLEADLVRLKALLEEGRPEG